MTDGGLTAAAARLVIERCMAEPARDFHMAMRPDAVRWLVRIGRGMTTAEHDLLERARQAIEASGFLHADADVLRIVT